MLVLHLVLLDLIGFVASEQSTLALAGLQPVLQLAVVVVGLAAVVPAVAAAVLARFAVLVVLVVARLAAQPFVEDSPDLDVLVHAAQIVFAPNRR